MRAHTSGRVVLGMAAGLMLVLAAPLSASAHVSIDPERADPGATATFMFTVPNESAAASTTKVEFDLPVVTPELRVRYAPLPGWQVDVVDAGASNSPDAEASESGGRVVLTAADGAGLRPGQFLQWTVSLGPIPDTGQVSFVITQTYDDGEVVVWGATPAEVEADSSLRPAPTLFITDEPTGHGSAATSGGGEGSDHEPAGTAGAGEVGPSPVVGLILSALAVAVALGALAIVLVRTRKVG